MISRVCLLLVLLLWMHNLLFSTAQPIASDLLGLFRNTTLLQMYSMAANRDHFLQTLHVTLDYCRQKGKINPYLPSALASDEQACNLIQFAAHIEYLQEQWILRSHKLKKKVTKIEAIAADEFNYQDFFSKYAQNRVPVVVTPSKAIQEFVKDDIETCFDAQGAFEPTQLNCKQALQHVYVPFPMVNDYISRLDKKVRSSVSRLSPQVIQLQPKRTKWLGCPYDAHMMILPTTSSSVLRVTVLDQQDAASMLPKGSSVTLEMIVAMVRGTGNLDPYSLVDPYLSKDDPLRESYPEFFKFQRKKTVLKKKQAIFIPSGVFAAVQGKADDTPVTVLRWCFVDASNFVRVHDQLSVDALVNAHARKLLTAFSNPSFDTSMARRPDEAMAKWIAFTKWPKKKDLASEDSTEAKDGKSRRERFKTWQDDTKWNLQVRALTLPIPMSPLITAIGRRNVTVLFPSIFTPRKEDITKYGYELRPYLDKGNLASIDELSSKRVSKKVPGFVTRLPAENLTPSKIPTIQFGEHFDGSEISYTIKQLLPNTTYCFTVALFVGEANGTESDCSQRIETSPLTPPASVPGIPKVKINKKISGSVEIMWKKPIDDGGVEIDHFLISRREVRDTSTSIFQNESKAIHPPENFKHAVAASADLNTVTIKSLIYSHAYQFRVAAVNSEGIGEWSTPTTLIKIPKVNLEGGVAHVSGKGHAEYQNVIHYTVDENGESTWSKPAGHELKLAKGPIVLLSDRFQELRLLSSFGNKYFPEPVVAEVWSSHHSPNLYNVTAEIVQADPADASTPFKNAADVRDRLVFAVRGNVPFRTKAFNAQQAGALGIIVGDMSGQCDRKFNQHCSPGADKSRGEGFAAQDHREMWQGIKIPCVLLHKQEAETLVKLLVAIPKDQSS